MTSRSAFAAGLLVFFDQLTKLLISNALGQGESIPVLPGLFHLTLVHNTGISFGLLKGMLPVFILLSAAVILFIIFYAGRFSRSHGILRAGLVFILGGTIGNLIDRIRLGYVIDFIDLRVWPVFNIADFAITVGGLLVACHIFRKQHVPHSI